MSNLAVIPAKEYSQRLTNKNTKIMNGKPMINYTVDHALNANMIDNVLVSTESSKISKVISKFYENYVQVRDRPIELAQTDVTFPPILNDALVYYEAHKSIHLDAVVLLSPTHPFRSNEIIDSVLKKFYDSNCDTLVCAFECKRNIYKHKPVVFADSFSESYHLKEKQITRIVSHADVPQQERSGVWIEDIGFCTVYHPNVVRLNQRYGSNVDVFKINSIDMMIDVDDQNTFDLAEFIVRKHADKKVSEADTYFQYRPHLPDGL